MNRKPIGPTAHGAIDYAFGAINALAPSLFGLSPQGRAICHGFAATQGILNALTDYPLGVKGLIPIRVHGELETPYIPAILLLPWLVGAMKHRNDRLYFLSIFAIAAATYTLTDYNAYEPAAPLPSGQKLLAMAESAAT